MSLISIGVRLARRTTSIFFILCVITGLAFVTPGAHAMTYVPMSDSDLLDQAELVVIGRIVDAEAVSGRELDQTDYTLSVDEVIKGSAGNILRIRLPGAINPAQNGALIVPGIPRFSSDEKVLLFLRLRADGIYSVVQFALGRFRYAETVAHEALWERDLSETQTMDGMPDPYNQFHRDATRFAEWLRSRASGRFADEAYWSQASGFIQSKYALASPLGRWFEFDRNQTVAVYAGSAALLGLSSGGYPELQEAINAWNNDSGSNIRLRYAGLHEAAGGLELADGVTQVIFNDPGNEIAGTFDCLLGGIGALGQWRGGGLQLYKGRMYRTITEGDIVVQDGIGCLLDNRRQYNTQELLAHELGHVLGLDHSCGDGLLATCESGSLEDDALMRPTLHADGRGAALGEDDRAAVAYLYSNSVVADPPELPEPGNSVSVPQASSSGGGAIPPALLLGLMLLGALRLRCESPRLP